MLIPNKSSTQSTDIKSYEQALIDIEMDRAIQTALEPKTRSYLAPYSAPVTSLSARNFPPQETFRLMGTKAFDKLNEQEAKFKFIVAPIKRILLSMAYTTGVYQFYRFDVTIPIIASLPYHTEIMNMLSITALAMATFQFIKMYILIPEPKILSSVFLSVNGNLAFKYYQIRLSKFKFETTQQYVVVPSASKIIVLNGALVTFSKSDKITKFQQFQDSILTRRFLRANQQWIKTLELLMKQTERDKKDAKQYANIRVSQRAAQELNFDIYFLISKKKKLICFISPKESSLLIDE